MSVENQNKVSIKIETVHQPSHINTTNQINDEHHHHHRVDGWQSPSLNDLVEDVVAMFDTAFVENVIDLYVYHSVYVHQT